MAVNPFDKAARFAAKLDSPEFLRWVLGVRADALVFRSWLDTRQTPLPADRDRVNDTIAWLDRPGGLFPPWAVVLEFQTVPDADMFGRLLEYMGAVWRTLRPDKERGSRFQVGSVVVNLTGNGSASQRMEWPDVGFLTHLMIRERNLEGESATELLSRIESGEYGRCLLPWVPLMAGADDPDLVDRWKRLAETEVDSRRRAEYGGISRLFAGRVGRKDLWNHKLEGWNVEESDVVKEWITEGRMESLLDILTAKFATVPADVAAGIRRTTAPDRLRDWLRLAATAPDLPTFRQQAGL